MRRVGKDIWEFEGSKPKTRRLSVREAARIQTFPDDFLFYYQKVADGYKMVGNAVPVKLAEIIARKIKSDFEKKPEINVNPLEKAPQTIIEMEQSLA